MTDGAKRRVETLAPWAAGLLLACPILVAHYPPMTDVPYHEAAIGILRHFGNTSMFPPGLYERNLGEPNQLFHMVGWALAYVVSTRWAVKVVVASAVVAIPVCAARFARHVGSTPLAALVVAPMTLGWLFSWGLVANLIGLAALLAVLPVLDRFASQPTARGAFACAGAAVLLYFAHEAMLFVFGGTALALALLHPASKKKTPLRLVPFVASAAITVIQARWQMRYMLPAFVGLPSQWDSALYKLKLVPAMILQAMDVPVQVGMMVLCAGTVSCFFWLRARERTAARSRTAPAHPLQRARAWSLAHRWELFVSACLVAYLAFPFSLNGATYVYQRWFPPGFAVLVVIAAPRDLWTRAARVPRILVAALPVATLLVAAPAFADSSRQYEALEAILPHIELGSSVAGIDLGPVDPARTYWLGAASGRVLATRGGRLAFAFTYSTVSPIVISTRYQWTETVLRMGIDPWTFIPAHDFQRFRYLLLRSSDARVARVAVRALRSEADYVATSGEWMLFESRLPTLPLLSADSPIEGHPPATLRERIMAMLPAELEESAQETWPAPGRGSP